MLESQRKNLGESIYSIDIKRLGFRMQKEILKFSFKKEVMLYYIKWVEGDYRQFIKEEI